MRILSVRALCRAGAGHSSVHESSVSILLLLLMTTKQLIIPRNALMHMASRQEKAHMPRSRRWGLPHLVGQAIVRKSVPLSQMGQGAARLEAA